MKTMLSGYSPGRHGSSADSPIKGSNAQFYPNLWNNNEEEMKKSLDKLYNQKSTFTLNFEGTELDGELMGTTVNGQGINSSVNGTWKATELQARSASA